MNKKIRLDRAISLPMLVFYGLGTIIGAGIYVLIGEVAGQSGLYAPISFIFAGILAFFTAISYAELSSRYPNCAGAVMYVQQAFKLKGVSSVIGLLVIFIAIVAAATLANGFSGYLKEFVDIPNYFSIIAIVLGLGFLAAWGIKESVTLAAVATLIEVGGLVFIIFIAGDSLLTLPERLPEMIPMTFSADWTGIFLGAFLAFFAFIGFEDIVNVAEETKKPRHTLPIAIILSLSIAAFFYLLIAIIAILSLPIDELAGSEAPLARILEQYGSNYPIIISFIGLFAIVNGALVQIILASRVLYGMSEQKIAPKFFNSINPFTKTPLLATILVTFIIIAFALWFPIVSLANATSFLTLIVFSLINISLVVIKIKHPNPANTINYPLFLPIIAFCLTAFFLVFMIVSLF